MRMSVYTAYKPDPKIMALFQTRHIKFQDMNDNNDKRTEIGYIIYYQTKPVATYFIPKWSKCSCILMTAYLLPTKVAQKPSNSFNAKVLISTL